jgi:tetratricopeptide (TPR) repeat protein
MNRGQIMRRSSYGVFFIVAAALALTGCKNFIQKSAMNTTADILTRAKASTQQEPDVELARAAIPGAIKTVEGFHIANPGNKKLVAMLAEGYCGYANGFVQDEWEVAKMEGRYEDAEKLRGRASKLFLRCMNYGLKLLPKKWGEAITGDLETFKALVAKAGKGKIKGMFWTAFGLGSAINMNRDDIEMIAHLPKAKAMLERVIELDPDFQWGMPYIALGMMNSALGKALGGKPELAKEYFEKARAVTDGKFLMVNVMQARTYAVINQDRKLFRKLLIDTLTTNPAVFPDQRLANELAHHKARRYLSQEKDWF